MRRTVTIVAESVSDTDVLTEPPGRTVLEFDTTSVVRVTVAALGAMLLYAILRLAPSMLTKIGVGVVLALALDPVVVRVRARLGWQRGTAVALVGAVLTAGFLSVLLVLGPAAIDQASTLRRDLPATIEETYSWPIIGERLADADAAVEVDRAIDELPAQLNDADIERFAEGVLGGLLTAVVILITAVTVMLDGELLINRVRSTIRHDHQGRVVAVSRVIYQTFGSYFAGSLFVAILNGLVMLTIALALGIPLAPLIGLWAALTNLIPQIGGFLGGSFLIVLAFTEGPVVAVIAAVCFVLYQQIENNIIGPAIVGKAVDLTPPTTMLAALVGAAVAGVPGALVATPILAAGKALYLRDRADGAIDGDGIDQPTAEEVKRAAD